jgi:dTDP-4-amino-4,6-dideoxygalactose transaminase
VSTAHTREIIVPFAPPVLDGRDSAAIQRVLESGWLTTGDECLTLESELAALLGAQHVVTTASCTAALEIAYASLTLPAGARVGVPTWTFVSTALAAHHQGATPILLDIEPATLNLAPDALESALQDGLDALIVVHFAGNPVDAVIYDLCREHGVPVIEDAAHALGAQDHRGPIAGRGTVGAAFSFYATKNLMAGEGGALATDDDAVAEFARSFRLHGLSSDAWERNRLAALSGYDLIGPGLKANLSDLHAALARSQLTRFADFQVRRRELVMRYRSRLAETSDIRAIPEALREDGADHLMVVVLPSGSDRDHIRQDLGEAGIATSVHFRPLHDFAWFREHAVEGAGGLGRASEIASHVLSLPLSPALTVDQVDKVCGELLRALG